MRFKKHLLPLAAIFALIAFIATTNYLWLNLNTQPPVDDEAIHLISALKYLHILQHPSVDILTRLARVDVLYPPVFPFVAALVALALGQASTFIFCMTNVLFLAVLFFCMYFIGLKTANRWSGVLAAYFLMLYPMFFHLSRMFMIEVALVCMVTLCITLLMYSGNFKKRGMCLLAGISFGLGLLTKQTFLFFVVGPAVFFFLKGFSGFNVKERDRLINAGLFIAAGLCMALPWYLADFHIKYSGALRAVSDASLVPYRDLILSFRSYTYYFSMLISVQLMALFSIFLLLALILLFVFRKTYKMRLFVVWIFVPYVIMSLLPNKFYYYTLPFLPALAFLTALGVLAIRMKFLQIALGALLVIWGVRQFIILSFFSPLMLCAVLQGAYYTPRIYASEAMRMVARITEEFRDKSMTIGVLHIDGNEANHKKILIGNSGILLNMHMLQYAFDFKGLLCEVIDLRVQERRHDGRFCEFIVLPCPLQDADSLSSLREHYQLIDVFELSDLSRVYLYRVIKGAVSPVTVNMHGHERVLNPFEFDKEIVVRVQRLMPFLGKKQ